MPPKGAPPPGWRPTVKTTKASGNFATETQGGDFRTAGPTAASRSPAVTKIAQNTSSSPPGADSDTASLVEQLKGFGSGSGDGYGAWARAGPSAPDPGAPQDDEEALLDMSATPFSLPSSGGVKFGSLAGAAGAPPGGHRLPGQMPKGGVLEEAAIAEAQREAMEEEEALQDLKELKASRAKREEAARHPTPNWQLPSKLEGEAAQSARAVERAAAQATKRAPSPPKPPVRKRNGPLILDLNSHVVDLCTSWAKSGKIPKFELAGKTDEGVDEFSKVVTDRGELFPSDFSNHGIELILSEPKRFLAQFEVQDELYMALKRDLTITNLRLDGTGIDNQGSDWLAGALMKNKTVQELGFGMNEITDDGLQGLTAALEKNRPLKILHLNGNKIGNEGALAIAEALSRNTCLQELDLSDNLLSDEALEHLAQELDTNCRSAADGESGLVTLKLAGNKFSEAAIEELTTFFHSDGCALQSIVLGEDRVLQKLVVEELLPSKARGRPEPFLVECANKGVVISKRKALRKKDVDFTQDMEDLEIIFKRGFLKKGERRECSIKFGKQKVKIVVKGETLIDTELFAPIRPEDCTWTLSDGELTVTLAKVEPKEWTSLQKE